MSGLLKKIEQVIDRISGEFSGDEVRRKLHITDGVHALNPLDRTAHRYESFSPERVENKVKWFVDGCSYFWAVSEAIENAKESIWILDWWLSPELYLRRPPHENKEYRLDRMLQRAAQRGVKVNIIVYKEVTQVLTLSSWHTKHELEALDENICVMRHPNHLVGLLGAAEEAVDKVEAMMLSAAEAAKLNPAELENLYGSSHDMVLYWAHHEKLCLIDQTVAFMGGLDMCFGRWDTNQHAIADAHPSDLHNIVFPGQDYNNARIMDFYNVQDWKANKLDRRVSPRMGWSDISMTLSGPVVSDLNFHFMDRWNFIYGQKYKHRKRYSMVKTVVDKRGILSSQQMPELHLPVMHAEKKHKGRLSSWKSGLNSMFGKGKKPDVGAEPSGEPKGGVACQIVRSCTKWSAGVETEHSIANAYIWVIRDAKHFIYIENQFFITATGDKQDPVGNLIGKAIADRIIQAAEAKQKFKVIVCMPAVPAFAGDLRADASLGTRAIMEYQYNSICRGGNSIMDRIRAAGFEPLDYIRFYNLRNYDRINVSHTMKVVEDTLGITYEDARMEADDDMGAGYEGKGEETKTQDNYNNYEKTAQELTAEGKLSGSKWDTVSACYMEGGEDLTTVPWHEGNVPEVEAFVSEELYIHSKVLIADDKVVICGSANLNDRSQLGSHDSEIAVVVEDPTAVESTMDGAPYTASLFATTLRRQLCRKHLGLLPPQDMRVPTSNFHGIAVPNEYDFKSADDKAVADPLSDAFQTLWTGRAKNNTDIFARVFQPIPHDSVKTWNDYDAYYTKLFTVPKDAPKGTQPKYQYGHVVLENFEKPETEVKEALSKVKGSLVEMPLLFLSQEDIAKSGLSLNRFTDEVYT